MKIKTTQAHLMSVWEFLMQLLGNDRDICALERNVFTCFLSSRSEGKGDDCTKWNLKATIKNGSKIKQIHLLTNEEAFKKYLVYTFKDWCSSISREKSGNGMKMRKLCWFISG